MEGADSDTAEHGHTQAQSIPVLNLKDTDEQSLIDSLRFACEEYGFFYLTGHGLEEDIQAQFREARRFFSLSRDVKMLYAVNTSNHGYVWHGEETLDPQRQSEADTKENFQFGEERLHVDSRPLHGPNIWPSDSVLPNWKNNLSGYYQATTKLAMCVCRLLAKSLGLEDTYFDEKFTDPLSLIAMNHYSPRRSNPEKGVFGCGEHSDYVIITLLATDDVGGLQVRLKDDMFLDVQPMQNAFICNIGDAIQLLTNDRYRSAPHRVVNTSGRERYSTGLFFRPNFDFTLECLPSCCSEDNPPRYQPIAFGQHLTNKFVSSHTKFQTSN